MAASPPPALGRLPAASRALLLLAALEGTGDLGVLAAAAGRSGVLDGLPPLEKSLLVSVDEHTGRLVFLHPLARDAAVGISTALERRRAHRAPWPGRSPISQIVRPGIWPKRPWRFWLARSWRPG